MKATTEVIELKHMLRRPTWRVQVRIEFSEVERAIIKNSRLGDFAIYDQIGLGDPLPISLRDVVKYGIWSVFPSAHEAAGFRHKIETETLPGIKRAIDESGNVTGGVKTLEF